MANTAENRHKRVGWNSVGVALYLLIQFLRIIAAHPNADNNKSDGEMSLYYNTADVVCLPYHKTSSLNSGAVYLSFSLKKTVICPDIGTIKDMQGADFIYDYSYKDESEHLERLKRAMMLVCADYEEDRELIKNRGKAAYEYVKQVHSDAIVGEKYAEIYRTLCRGKTHV